MQRRGIKTTIKSSKSEIKEIPKEKTLPDVFDICSICLDTPTTANVSSLDSCDHYYCYLCIVEWSKSSNTCPLCKKRFHSITKPKPQEETKKRKRDETDSPPNKKAKEDEVTVVPNRDLRDTQGPGIMLFNNLFALGATLNLDLNHIRRFLLTNIAGNRPAPQYREVNGVIDLTDEIEISESDEDSEGGHHHNNNNNARQDIRHYVRHQHPAPLQGSDSDSDAEDEEPHVHNHHFGHIHPRVPRNDAVPITIDLSELPEDEPNVVIRPAQQNHAPSEVIELLDD